MTTKTCTKCGEEKPATNKYFNRQSAMKDGLNPRCKPCRQKSNREYDARNREMRRLYQVEYRRKNKEVVVEYQRQYNKKLPCALYIIENKKNGMIYVGATTMLKIRWRTHKLKLRQQKHSNRLLQEDHNKYGPDAFRFEVVEEYPSDTPFETLEKIESEKIKCFLAEGRKLYNKPRGMRI